MLGNQLEIDLNAIIIINWRENAHRLPHMKMISSHLEPIKQSMNRASLGKAFSFLPAVKVDLPCCGNTLSWG